MTTNVKLSGDIVIGTTPNTISIPVDTALPPATPGTLMFTYTLPAGQTPTAAVVVGEFLKWAADMLKMPDISKDLPASLAALSIGVNNLLIDTSGKFDIGVLFGTLTGTTWSSSWKPIDALPFAFNDLKLEVDYTSA